MRPEEVLRAARGYIEAGGHSRQCHAVDGEGKIVPLWVTGSSESGRAVPNPAAVGHSLYGAIVRAIHASPTPIVRPTMIWDVTYRLAKSKVEVALGGNNHVHPLHQFNDDAGPGEAAEFLEEAAKWCERIGDGPYDPPVRAPQRDDFP